MSKPEVTRDNERRRNLLHALRQSFTERPPSTPAGERAQTLQDAADHLAQFVFSLSDQAARQLHAVMLHRRDRGHFEEAPESYAEALTELQRHEVLAWHEATRDWLMPPAVGHFIHLAPAGDASESP